MRGNRLNLVHRLKNHKSYDNDLIEDGIFALKMLQSHLETNGQPYLEQDPVADIITIRKYLNLLTDTEPKEVTDIVNSIARNNPFYSDELLD